MQGLEWILVRWQSRIQRNTVSICIYIHDVHLKVFYIYTRKRSQKSVNSGLSTAFKLSFVAASTLTYSCDILILSVFFTSCCIEHLNKRVWDIEQSIEYMTWVIGFNVLIFSGNWAFVTRNVDMCLRCSSSTRAFISGYIIGSPTRDNAQCLGDKPSSSFSGFTPENATTVLKTVEKFLITQNILELNKINVRQRLLDVKPRHSQDNIRQRLPISWSILGKGGG